MTQLSTRHCANRSLYPKLKFQEKVWACLMNLTWDLEPMSQKAIEEIISLSFTDLSWSWFILTIVSFILKKTRQAYTCWTAVYQFDIWEVVHSIIAKEWNLRSIRDAFVLFFFSPYSQILTLLFCWIFISIFNNLAFQWTLETWFKRKVTLFMDIENGSSRPA